MHAGDSPIPDVTSSLMGGLYIYIQSSPLKSGGDRGRGLDSVHCPSQLQAHLYLESTDMASHLVAALCLAALFLGSCFGAPTIRTTVGNTGQQQQNSDVLARLQDRVSISCMDGSTSRAGSIRVNGVPKGQDGRLIIDSMSVEDQGRYKCCVDDECQEIAIISESESGRRSLYMPL